MIFDAADYKAAFFEAYQWGLAHAGPVDAPKMNAMCLDLQKIDVTTGKGLLLHELIKANIAYIAECYGIVKEGGS